MKANAYLFYDNELVQEFDFGQKVTCSQYLHTAWGLKVYNGGFLYLPNAPHNSSCWYRCDWTPARLQDVPKIYLVMALLLT